MADKIYSLLQQVFPQFMGKQGQLSVYVLGQSRSKVIFLVNFRSRWERERERERFQTFVLVYDVLSLRMRVSCLLDIYWFSANQHSSI